MEFNPCSVQKRFFPIDKIYTLLARLRQFIYIYLIKKYKDMTTKDIYLSELYIRATEIFAQMTKIAQHISNLLEDKRFKEIESWGLIWDDLEAEVESIILIREALL